MMRGDLVGYFLGALHEDDEQRVEEQLENHREFREELDRIGQALRPLEDPDVAPPAGLADGTVELVLRQRAQTVGHRGRSSHWRLIDLAVAASILVVMSLILVPSLKDSRHRQDVAQCAYNLQAFAAAVHSYAEQHGGYFPVFSTSGPLAITGMYAPLLLEAGLVTDRTKLVCPGSNADPTSIPSLTQLQAAARDPKQLRHRVQSLGGGYAYALGVKEAGRYYLPRLDRTAGHVLMSDQPPENAIQNSPNHSGTGQNVLYLDGTVAFLTSPQVRPQDNIYENKDHRVGPGIGWDDAVCGKCGIPLNGE